ncbi:hypothetical protein [Hymenobacter sp. B81]|uniref:hypothetical protein n=1 Tax=Hymenobacter sp. B81 TaxID=3344878 RepID=UPI0037DC9747
MVSTEVLQIEYRADLLVLVGRWMRQPTEQELHAGYEQLLAAALAQGCRLWLIDARRRSDSNKGHSAWMVQHFFPRLAQLNSEVSLAYLFMPHHLREIEQDPQVPPLSFFGHLPYKVQRFTEEQAAMAWLADCRRRLRPAPVPQPL